MTEPNKKWSKDYVFFPIVILSNAVRQLLCGEVHNFKEALSDVLSYCFYYSYTQKVGSPSDRFNQITRELRIISPAPSIIFQRGKQVFDSIPTKSPKTSIKKNMLLEFHSLPKNEFQIISFLAFAALKSIIQRQELYKCTDRYLISRMAGNSTASEAFPDWIKKYDSRHHLDKIKMELQLNWGLKLYGNNVRGYYVSFTKSLKYLAVKAEKKKKSNRIKKLKQMKEDAKIYALKRLEINDDEQNQSSNDTAL